MPKAEIVAAIIRKRKTSGKAFFGNEHTTGPRVDLKSPMPSTDTITQISIFNEPTFEIGGKKPCEKMLFSSDDSYLKSRTESVRE